MGFWGFGVLGFWKARPARMKSVMKTAAHMRMKLNQLIWRILSMPVLPGIKVFVALRILTEEVPRGPVLVGEGHVQLPVLLHQPLELTISSNL